MGFLFFLLFIATLGVGVWRSLKFTRVKNGYSTDLNFEFKFKPFLAYCAGAFLIFVLWLAFTTVDTGYRGVVLRLGAPTGRTLEPGPHFVMPFADSVAKVNVQTQIVKPDAQASSHDLQVVHTQVTLGYYTDPTHVGYIYSQLNDDAKDRVITPAILEAIKAVTARYDAEQLVANRPAVRDGIETFVKERLAPHHIIVDSVSITDFAFSQDYNNAIEAKVTAAQNALKAENDLKRIKIEADQKVAAAEGEAKALKAQKEQITPQLLQLRTIEMLNNKWDGHLPQVTAGNSIPVLDVLKAAGK